MRIALIASELAPFAKTGGLADAVAGLAGALADEGHDVSVLVPRYRAVSAPESPLVAQVDVALDGVELQASVQRVVLERGPSVCFIDIPELFDRPGLYGDTDGLYADNLLRFCAFSRAALAALDALELRCDIVHAHDWQAALVPLALKLEERSEAMAGCRTVLTIHNLAYQGIFPGSLYRLTGLHQSYFDVQYTEFYGGVNLLKGGIVAADRLTTVSPTYAREVLEPDNGAGLDGVLRDREKDFCGILNGVDTQTWNPRDDPHIACRYSGGAPQGKGKCKRALLDEVGLSGAPDAPLVGVVTRLIEQKGSDLLADAFSRLIDTDARFVVLGTGAPDIEDELRALGARYAERIAVRIDFDEGLAHRIQAGADYLLMPSRFEPCGLNQMYAMRYGTVPIVSAVGGLADTVADVEADPQTGTGFVLDEISADGVVEGVERALAVYRRPRIWAALRRRGAKRDFSWGPSAARYIELYRDALEASPADIPPGPASF